VLSKSSKNKSWSSSRKLLKVFYLFWGPFSPKLPDIQYALNESDILDIQADIIGPGIIQFFSEIS